MRLFFAALLPADLLTKLAEAQARVRERIGDSGIKWVRPEQFHYTLKFLGEESPKQAYRAVEGAQVVAAARAPFDLALGGIGAFPNESRPGVLWIGATDGADALVDLAATIDRALSGRGFRRDKAPMKAHLTIARVKGYAGECATARELKTIEVGEVGRTRISEFALMQSMLRPTGAEYGVVERFKLGA